jgi:glucose-1-phosphate cytidylyltransferase
MKVVLLAGGLGTRLREETEFRPKPMVTVGGFPILWHIMKAFAFQGFTDFVIAAGYKAEVINEYFSSLSGQAETKPLGDVGDFRKYVTSENWNISIVQTGENTLTGGRLLHCKNFLRENPFICTYGDGLSDVNLSDLVKFHESHGALGTVTAAHPVSRFGVLGLGEDSVVKEFKEKQIESTWVNSGYFVFNTEIFDYLDSTSALEDTPLRKLVSDRQLYAWQHRGNWKPMDTHREKEELEHIWASGSAFWKKW